jgi:hypothetical protein
MDRDLANQDENIRFSAANSTCSPWSAIENSAPVPNELPPRELPRPAGDNRFTVITDLPNHIPITAAELDILEAHVGELVRSMLAGDHR